MVYNKTIFADNGIEIPTTYDEFAPPVERCQRRGSRRIYETVSDGWHHVLSFAELGPAYEAASPGLYEQLNSNETTLSADPTMELALGQLNDLYTNNCFGENTLSDEFADTEANMASGEFAMTVDRLGLPAQIETADPTASADNYRILPDAARRQSDMERQPAAPAGSSTRAPNMTPPVVLRVPRSTGDLQFVLDNEPQFVLLDFDGTTAELSEARQAFVDAYPDQGTVLQTAVNYVNPQWIEMGQDIVAMFTGAQDPAGVLESIDNRRAEMATAADDAGWSD